MWALNTYGVFALARMYWCIDSITSKWLVNGSVRFVVILLYLLQLSSSFYVYQVLWKLPKGAEKILNFMGYKATTSEMQELKYDGDVNSEQVLETAADLVILHSELDLIKELVRNAIHTSHSDRAANFLTLWNILEVRACTDERYDDTWQRLMKKAYQSQREANLQLYPPRGPPPQWTIF